ncbi:hypothetical protein DSO57_1023488 [Entomophthora muscae]|uniref:Uncharacterized protein n=1 Tax=Entomophthora muscae TaxID=34485 RepID=A0ACC2T2Q5_9FUNG|nr:hypothetical protein DSO57_1023488 [Entomophthora muscae]
MMAEQLYQNEKHPLSTPESASPLNKKKNSNYIIDHNGPTLSPLIKARRVRSRGPSPLHDQTPPPLNHHEREANPSPEEHPVESSSASFPETQSTFELYGEIFEEGTHTPPTTPSLPSPHPNAINSKWNPEHPNPFAALEEQLDFDDSLLAEEDPRYNVFTVETVPETPANQSNHYNANESNLEIKEVNPSSSHVSDMASAPGATSLDEVHPMKSELPDESAHDCSNQLMKTSSLVDDEIMCNQPI